MAPDDPRTAPLFEDRGLPMGLQLLGLPHRDYALGCIGAWMQQVYLGDG